MVESLYLISTISYILAGIFFIVALVMWIKFDIPDVIGDLSGKNAKKSIQLMREDNVKRGSKSYKVNMVPENSKRLLKKTEEMVKKTTYDATEKLHKTVGGMVSGDERFETMVLSGNKEEVLGFVSEETVMLSECSDTEVLVSDVTAKLDVANAAVMGPKVEEMTLIDEVVLVHTTEVI